MKGSYEFLAFERSGDVLCARLKSPHVEDKDMEDLGAEMGRLLDDEKAYKIVFCLGPEDPDCLISVFLAKLISLQRRLERTKGALALAHVSEHTRGIFRAAGIEKLFHIYPDAQAASAALQALA